MTRAYLRLDPLFDERKSHYPDGPYATFVAILCLGETQPRRGRFRSAKFLRALLERRGRFVSYLIDHNDLRVEPDGTVYICGWDEWQEGDWKVTERVQRIRARRNGTAPVTVDVTPDVTQDVTVDVTPDVTQPTDTSRARAGHRSEAVLSEAVLSESVGPLQAYNQLTARAPSRGVMDWLDRLGQEYGDDATCRAMGTEWQADSDIKSFIGRVEVRLASAHRKAEQQRDSRRKSAAIEEMRDLERRLEEAPPEEQEAMAQRKAELDAWVEGQL